ncbi:Hypothetical_protein [Hexamita inflata]|uniref:Hypothetical_protein n=1 Tax=Hexamita inflata TaxID=28002 RepID=A0AA86PAV3_9EUKA|nr:Hypothetical protein HINF_LOCUS20965 [Hexamita inflata]
MINVANCFVPIQNHGPFCRMRVGQEVSITIKFVQFVKYFVIEYSILKLAVFKYCQIRTNLLQLSFNQLKTAYAYVFKKLLNNCIFDAFHKFYPVRINTHAFVMIYEYDEFIE